MTFPEEAVQAMVEEQASFELVLDDLARAIDRVEEAMRQRAFKASAIVPVPYEHDNKKHFLAWRLISDRGWALMLVTRNGDDEKQAPLRNTPRGLRIAAVTQLEALFVRITLAHREEKRDVQAAIEACDRATLIIAGAGTRTPSR
jgi:hypothetical protein